MPAHQHCDLFYPLGWGSDWVYHKLGNILVLRSGTGSWVLSGQSPSAQSCDEVGSSKPTKERKKETKKQRKLLDRGHDSMSQCLTSHVY